MRLKIILSVLIAGAIVIVFVVVFSRQSEEAQPVIQSSPHFYKNSDVGIANIKIKMFYVVPKNRTSNIVTNWQNFIEEALAKTSKFHEIQFRGKSTIQYDIYPKPVILQESNQFYDTETTARGNPHALIAISEEIERRVFKKEGDLYDEKFAAAEKSEYPVLGLIYEGVGASGGVIYESDLETRSEIAKQLGLSESVIFIVEVESADGFFLLSRVFFTESQYRIFSSTLFYHEFAHTFGLPDQYDIENNVPSSNDIMGAGRKKPIEIMYLDRELTRDMGIVE